MSTVYRNGTYIAFHAQGTSVPVGTDMKYYNLLKAWSVRKDDDFTFINSHEKTAALKSTSTKETLRNRLAERLRNYSKNMILFVGEDTRFDDDWVPFEIEYAVDKCRIPIIVTYVNFEYGIQNPMSLSHLWPYSLKVRIENGTASCLHIPFKKKAIADAIGYDLRNKPDCRGLGVYSAKTYKDWDIEII